MQTRTAIHKKMSYLVARSPAKMKRKNPYRGRPRVFQTVTMDKFFDRDTIMLELHEMMQLLRSEHGMHMFRNAFQDSMHFKVERYTQLLSDARANVERQVDIIRLKMPQLKHLAGVKDEHDNWQIFESISEQFRESTNAATTFEDLLHRAKTGLTHSKGSRLFQSRNELVECLGELRSHASQPHVVKKVIDLLGSFLKNPSLFRMNMMNFMLVGRPGTGKTTIAEVIGKIFAKAGIFVGDRLIEAGRAELVGQYEGQTVARTRSFLTSNLDNGVIFIDEAYAITPWHNGKPEGYGSEATATLVQFMTKFKGLYCIIVAGYEQEMIRYFLGSNIGLARRFPNKCVLHDMQAADMIRVFKAQLLIQQNIPLSNKDDRPHPDEHRFVSTHYFTNEAWAYLYHVIHVATSGKRFFVDEYDTATMQNYSGVRKFVPDFPLMYTIFEAQAGSMTTLAEEALTHLISLVPFQHMTHKKPTRQTTLIMEQPVTVMRDILIKRIYHTALSQVDVYLDELGRVEQVY